MHKQPRDHNLLSFNERINKPADIMLLRFVKGKGRELVKEGVWPHMKRAEKGRETPGCSSSIVQPSASEGQSSLAGRFTQVP